MKKKLRYLSAISGVGLLMLFAGQAQAYICSGNGNEFQDTLCSEADLADKYNVSVDEFVLLAKDETTDELPDGVPDEENGGTLIITKVYPDTITFTYEGIAPLVIVEKYDGIYSVYDWVTQITDEGGGTYSFVRETDLFDFDGNAFVCDGNCNEIAGTSHVSAYGVVPIPAAVWLFGSALVGMTGIGYRRRRNA